MAPLEGPHPLSSETPLEIGIDIFRAVTCDARAVEQTRGQQRVRDLIGEIELEVAPRIRAEVARRRAR